VIGFGTIVCSTAGAAFAVAGCPSVERYRKTDGEQ